MTAPARPTALGLLALLLLAAVLSGLSAVPGASAAAPAASSTASTAVTGNVSGPTVLPVSGTGYYFINASGGPAFAANGTQVGNLSYFASLAGTNLTGVSFEPSESAFTGGKFDTGTLTLGANAEVLTLTVMITSVYQTQNESTNLTWVIHVVTPYVLSLSLLAGPYASVQAFTLVVNLDGTPVGTIAVPSLTANQSYVATFKYAVITLGSGEHTFTVSLANEHGLVTFAGGGTLYSTSFYVAGPAPDYTWWYVAGVAAFFGTVFILVTGVAARRRNPSKK